MSLKYFTTRTLSAPKSKNAGFFLGSMTDMMLSVPYCAYHILQALALVHIGVSDYIMVANIDILFVCIFSTAFLKRNTNYMHWLSALLVLVGIFMYMFITFAWVGTRFAPPSARLTHISVCPASLTPLLLLPIHGLPFIAPPAAPHPQTASLSPA